jgi:hypothetical protein
MSRGARSIGVALVLAASTLALLGACSRAGGMPAPPATPEQNLGPGEPPVVWIAGTLTDLTRDRLELREPAGSVVRLKRLAASATRFFRVSGDAWKTVDAGQVRTGDPACVETLMDRSNLLALRVFLDAGCGPA